MIMLYNDVIWIISLIPIPFYVHDLLVLTAKL